MSPHQFVNDAERFFCITHGPDVQDVFFTLPDTGNAGNYNGAITALNAYLVPRVNAAYARQSFYKLSQNCGETVQQFATRLKQAAKDCAFAGDMNNQIQDATVGKCSSAYVRCKLLEEGPNLTLDHAMEMAMLTMHLPYKMTAGIQID